MTRLAALWLVVCGCDRVFGLGDAQPGDAPTDGMECPAGYVAIPNAAHRYRFVDTAFAWQQAERNCEDHSHGTTTHLAELDSASEIVATRSLLPDRIRGRCGLATGGTRRMI